MKKSVFDTMDEQGHSGLPSVEDIERLVLRQADLSIPGIIQDALWWFFRILECVCTGRGQFDTKVHAFQRLSTISVENDPNDPDITPETVAFALVL